MIDFNILFNAIKSDTTAKSQTVAIISNKGNIYKFYDTHR